MPEIKLITTNMEYVASGGNYLVKCFDYEKGVEVSDLEFELIQEATAHSMWLKETLEKLGDRQKLMREKEEVS